MLPEINGHVYGVNVKIVWYGDCRFGSITHESELKRGFVYSLFEATAAGVFLDKEVALLGKLEVGVV